NRGAQPQALAVLVEGLGRLAARLVRRTELEVAGRQRERLVPGPAAGAIRGALARTFGLRVVLQRVVDPALGAPQVAEPVERVGRTEQHRAIVGRLAAQRRELALGLDVGGARGGGLAALLVDRAELEVEPRDHAALGLRARAPDRGRARQRRAGF